MSPQSHLKQRLGEPKILVAPGIFDAFGAMMAERAGFEALYVSGASIAYTRLGRPDIGLVSLEEVASVVGTISERTQLPLIVDADTGRVRRVSDRDDVSDKPTWVRASALDVSVARRKIVAWGWLRRPHSR